MGILSIIILSPLIGALAIIGLPSAKTKWIQRVATFFVAIPAILCISLWFQYDRTLGGFQFIERLSWVPQLGISYHVGADGISITLLILHAFCSFTGILISYTIKHRVKEYFIFFMLLITSIYGVFCALDLFFFYFFYEMAVIPMYPLIGIWGSTRKEYATMKLTLYITAGAVLALLGLLALYWGTGLQTFDLLEIKEHIATKPIDPKIQYWVFPAVVIGFGVIASLWPFHTWSPLGYAAAPSAVSMLHAGVLKKLGAYAIIRIAVNLMPEAAKFWLPWLAVLATINIVYCGFIAMAQKDMKFIIGYSSCSHMGYILLGISCMNVIGLNGAVLLMFSHGIMAALTFALIGHCYEETHTRMTPELGGLAKRMPFVASCFSMAAMASLGLPGFANFVAEIMIFLGAWDIHRISAILAIFGIVITATYLLRMTRNVFFGPLNPKWHDVNDAKKPFQKLPYVLLLAALLIIGIWPSFFIKIIDPAVQKLLRHPNFIYERTVASQVSEGQQ